MRVGTVAEIWRYPVKSMAGGRLQSCRIGALGIPGDRGWALRDDRTMEIAGAKRFPALMRCTARYLEEPREGVRSPTVEIVFPDGDRLLGDDPRVSARLSGLVGGPVSLWPVRPADDLDHYRRRVPRHPVRLEELLFERRAPLRGPAPFPPDLSRFTCPPGTYFDAYPLHLLTTAWLAEFGVRDSPVRFDRRRFRPNFLIETTASGKVELEWGGRRLRVGSARIAIEMRVKRCGMTTHAQPGLPRDTSVLRTVVRESAQIAGVYATVIEPGDVAVGDPVELVSADPVFATGVPFCRA